MASETENLSKIEEAEAEDGSIFLGDHALTNNLIIKRLIEDKRDFSVILFSSDNARIDGSAPLEQQHDFFSTSASLSHEPTGGIKEIKETGEAVKAIILATRQASFYNESTRKVPIAIVEQLAKKEPQKAWYCLPENHSFKPGDRVSVSPVTKYYRDGSYCKTHRLTLDEPGSR